MKNFLCRKISCLVESNTFCALQSVHPPRTPSICDSWGRLRNPPPITLIDVYRFDWVPKTHPILEIKTVRTSLCSRSRDFIYPISKPVPAIFTNGDENLLEVLCLLISTCLSAMGSSLSFTLATHLSWPEANLLILIVGVAPISRFFP